MAGNDYKTVSRGDKLRVPAPVWNSLLGLLHPFGKPRSGGGHVAKQFYARNPYAASTILVKNAHTDLSQFGVLGITTTTITDPATSADTLLGFKQQPIIEGNIPALASHHGKFVVAIEPIEAGKYGLCVASGVVIVQIDILDADHRYADVKDADAAKLQSKPIGAARILWKESGTGTKWAIVNIGVLPPAMFPVQIDQTGGSAGDATTQCSYTYTVRDLAGYQLGTGMTPLKRRPALGAMSPVDPSYGWGVGFYDYSGTFNLWDANEVPSTAEGC